MSRIPFSYLFRKPFTFRPTIFSFETELFGMQLVLLGLMGLDLVGLHTGEALSPSLITALTTVQGLDEVLLKRPCTEGGMVALGTRAS